VVADGGAVETVVLVSNPISTPGREATIGLHGLLLIITGASATQLQIRIRRGSTTAGQLVEALFEPNVAASTEYLLSFDVSDKPGDVAGQEYCVTVTETGATTNGQVYFVLLGGIVY
jgi:hypothetical protein